jgi:hypothetical protein
MVDRVPVDVVLIVLRLVLVVDDSLRRRRLVNREARHGAVWGEWRGERSRVELGRRCRRGATLWGTDDEEGFVQKEDGAVCAGRPELHCVLYPSRGRPRRALIWSSTSRSDWSCGVTRIAFFTKCDLILDAGLYPCPSTPVR